MFLALIIHINLLKHIDIFQAVLILVGCPACLRNFLDFLCELFCSLNESLFINVTYLSEISRFKHVTENFGDGLYQACKEVKFGTMNTRVIDFIGAGASNYELCVLVL